MKQTTLHSALKQEVKEVIIKHIEENYDDTEDIESRIDKLNDVDLVQYLIQIIEEKV